MAESLELVAGLGQMRMEDEVQGTFGEDKEKDLVTFGEGKDRDFVTFGEGMNKGLVTLGEGKDKDQATFGEGKEKQDAEEGNIEGAIGLGDRIQYFEERNNGGDGNDSGREREEKMELDTSKEREKDSGSDRTTDMSGGNRSKEISRIPRGKGRDRTVKKGIKITPRKMKSRVVCGKQFKCSKCNIIVRRTGEIKGMIDCDRCSEWLCMSCSGLGSKANMDRVAGITQSCKGVMYWCYECEDEGREGNMRFVRVRREMEEAKKEGEEVKKKLESQVKENEELKQR